MTLGDLQSRIHQEIPLSQAMAVSVVACSRDGVTLAAPLIPNRNHEGTAFGGSVSSLALLACWSLVNVWLNTIEGPFDYVVVQDSNVDFVKPVTADFTATSRADDASVTRFLATLTKHGRARITLAADISCGPDVCASLQARFVAQLKR